MIRPLALLFVLLLCASCAGAGSSAAGRGTAGGGASGRGDAASVDHPRLRPPASAAPDRAATDTTRTDTTRTARLHHVFPVRGRTSYSRAHHDYPATDIFAGCRSPVRAPVRGVVLEVSRHDRYRFGPDNPALRGGKFVSIRGADGVRYYGAHLRSLRSTIKAGRHVRAGRMIGRVGQSGNARGVGCHLHFGISPVCHRRDDWWIRRGEVWPYRFLQSWKRGGNRSPAHAVRRWRAHHGCPARPR